jgi:hypothetical protein
MRACMLEQHVGNGESWKMKETDRSGISQPTLSLLSDRSGLLYGKCGIGVHVKETLRM